MEHNTSKQIGDDEIDFGAFSEKLVSFILYPVKVWLKKPALTVFCLVAGLVGGVAIRYYSDKTYEAMFIIRPTEKNEKIHLKILSDLQRLLKIDDYETLAAELKIDKQIVASLSDLNYLNYATVKSKADSSNTTEISLSVTDPLQLTPLQNAILHYLNNNPYFQRIKELQQKSLKLKTDMVERDLELLDSLKKMQLRNYTTTQTTEKNGLFLRDLVNPTGTYTLSLERLNQRTGLLAQSYFMDGFFMAKPLVTPKQHRWPPRLVTCLAVAVPLSLIAVILIHLFLQVATRFRSPVVASNKDSQ